MNLPNVYCNLCKAAIATQFAGNDLLFGGRSLKPVGDPGHPWFKIGGDPHAELHLCTDCLRRLGNSFPLPTGEDNA
jgi:hypothetical protein